MVEINDMIHIMIKHSAPGGPYDGPATVIWIAPDGKTVGARAKDKKKTVFLIKRVRLEAIRNPP